MTAIVYGITMGTGFALSVDGNNPEPGSQLILNNVIVGDPDQQWSLVYYPPTASAILFNPGRGLYAAPKTLEKGAPVVLFPLPSPFVFSMAQTWDVVSNAPFVVRSAANENLNLNASGGGWGPGTKIIVYSWDHGGQPNEVWNFHPITVG